MDRGPKTSKAIVNQSMVLSPYGCMKIVNGHSKMGKPLGVLAQIPNFESHSINFSKRIHIFTIGVRILGMVVEIDILWYKMVET